jgi:anti-sigma B factor antagonist
MKYKLEKSGSVLILEMLGSLEGGWDTFQLKDEVVKQVEDGGRQFLIDLQKASFVNSTGIGVMVAMQITVATVEGEIKFCGISDRVRRSFQATGAGIWESMQIYRDREEALPTYSSP